MQKILDLEAVEKVETYNPDKEEKIIQTYVKRRVHEMQEHRRELKSEEKWKEADREYIPGELEFGSTSKRFETDQTDGYRTRLVPIGDGTQNWRSSNSAPTLLQKIQTAISIIIDNNPEAIFTSLQKKYNSTSDLANSLWKRNWQISGGKEVLKLFVFNLVKYGTAYGRSYPRVIKYNKEILTELDTENPEKNKYDSKEVVWYNDVARQNLDPFRTWIDEQSKPYDMYTTNDCYYELDFAYDAAEVEFGHYPNFKFVKKDSKSFPADDIKDKDDDKQIRKDIVTIGFYENRLKDIYVIKAVKDDIILHTCPVPNDDGLLSIWYAMWVLRSADRPDGISLWEIISQDKHMYDKWNNMTADQLTLSIMKFGYYTGTQALTGDGRMDIIPGMAKQITNGKIDWMQIPGPGQEAIDGLKRIRSDMDDSSGITPTMEGDVTGKTLGEIQLARESSLKRLKVPLENIAWAIEQDAYLTLSWMSQIYSTPEVKQFADEREMLAYEKENDVQHDEKFQETDPNTLVKTDPLTGQPVPDSQAGAPTPLDPNNPQPPGEPQPQPITATYLPKLALHLEDRDGQLFESEESRYFQVGKDIQVTSMKWKGMIKVIPKSLVGNSEIIMKQTKQEMANLLGPLFAGSPLINKKLAVQILKINEEDPQDWLPDIAGWNDEPYQIIPPYPAEPTIRFTIGWDDLINDPAMKEQIAKKIGIDLPPPQPTPPPLFVPNSSSGTPPTPPNMAGTGNNNSVASTVVPRGEISSPNPQGKSMLGGAGQIFRKQ